MPSVLYGNGTQSLVQGPGGGKSLLLTALNGLSCDDGDIALSAGGNAVDIEDDLNGIVPFRSSYQIEFQDNGAPSKFSAYIVCMDLGKAHA
jgi:ABC-type cobalamin transport system ATPase subunit